MENYASKETKANGSICYYNNKGQRHRLDGPAIDWVNGDKAWYINGKLHRLGGPAIEYASGHKSWVINSFFCQKNKHNLLALFYILEPQRFPLFNNIPTIPHRF